jgi:hypothetical protein
VLGGGRGSDNLDVAERFRVGALALVGDFLKKSGPLTARKVEDFLHDLRRELTDDERADEQVKALLTRLAGLSPEPSKSFYPPVGALPDDARNRVETAALADAVRHATSYPHFNLHVSGPRFSGTSTVLRAVEAAVKRHISEALVCYFDCAVNALPFSPEFRYKMGDTESLPESDAEAGRERVKQTLARLTGELAVELEMPALAGEFSVPRELFVAVRTQLKALETAETKPRRRVVILDGLDPTDIPLAKALSEIAVGLNDLRTGPRGISVLVGTRYGGDLVRCLEPSGRSSSVWLADRFQQVCPDGFSKDEADSLARILAEPSRALEYKLLEETDEALAEVSHQMQPTLIHAAMWHLRQKKDQSVDEEDMKLLFEGMKSGELSRGELPAGLRAFVAHMERVNDMLAESGVGKDGQLTGGTDESLRQSFVDTFLRSAGWQKHSGSKRTYRWQELEEAWNTVKG